MSKFNLDGMINVLAGLGGKFDKANKSRFGNFVVLDDAELTRLWLGEGLGKKIVSAPADDMTRNWFTVPGDETNKIQQEMERLKTETIVNVATKWARLYRGSLIVMGLEDGGELHEPANLKNVKGIRWLRSYSASRIPITTQNVVKDPNSPFFDEIEVFPVRRFDGNEFKVHRSRCLIFKGEPIPDYSQDLAYNSFYWGLSILQSIYQRLMNYGSIEQSIVNLMMELTIGKFTLSNLAELLAANNTKAIYTRMNIINASKSILNSVLLGENEKYERDTASVAGVAEVMSMFMMSLSAVAEIPVTKLFGKSADGMNATGEGDSRDYYDMITSKQKTWLKPPLQYLVAIINSYMKATDDPSINFNSVWEPTQKELIEMKNKQAQTDGLYIDKGVLDSDEVRESRFENGYSFETTVDDADGLPKKNNPSKKKKPKEKEKEA